MLVKPPDVTNQGGQRSLFAQRAESVHRPFLHPDLSAAECGIPFGQTDLRFDAIDVVFRNRLLVADIVGARSMATMVPQGGTEFVDLSRDTCWYTGGDFCSWPEDLRPESYTYEPGTSLINNIPCDGLITTNPGEALLLSPADCIPLVLYCGQNGVLALVHVGREGASKHLASSVIEYMKQTYDVDPGRLTAYFGPSIAPDSYTMPMRGASIAGSEWDPFVRRDEQGLYHVDVSGFTREQLLQSGVSPANISGSSVDVAVHPDHFSHTAFKAGKKPVGRNGFMVLKTAT